MKLDKYLLNEDGMDIITKKLISLSKDFTGDMKISRGKYQFQEVEGMIKGFLSSHIRELQEIMKKL